MCVYLCPSRSKNSEAIFLRAKHAVPFQIKKKKKKKISTSWAPKHSVISANNVGGVVMEGSLIIGLPEEVWDSSSCVYGIVLSKQSVRLVARVYIINNSISFVFVSWVHVTLIRIDCMCMNTFIIFSGTFTLSKQ